MTVTAQKFKTKLSNEISFLMSVRKLKGVTIAHELNMTESDVSRLKNGKLDNFSCERLARILEKLRSI